MSSTLSRVTNERKKKKNIKLSKIKDAMDTRQLKKNLYSN